MTAAMVLPVGDVNPTHRRPFVTVLVLVANVAVFFLLQPKQGCAAQAFLFEWAAIPFELLTLRQVPDQTVAELIGQRCAATVADVPVIVTAFSAMFLHANVAHLLGNMLFLWVFGNNVEDRLGHARFVLFYLGGGLAATYVFAFLNAGSPIPLLGASGAIAAILGAYLIMYPRARVHTYVPFPLYLLAAILPGIRITGMFLIFAIVTMPAFVVLLGWFALQLVSSGAPAAGSGVAYVAHVAGFVAGVVLVLLLDQGRRRRGEPTFHEARYRV